MSRTNNLTNNYKYYEGPKCFGTSARTSWFDQGDRTIPGPGTHTSFRFNKTNPPEWHVGHSTGRDTFLQKHHFPNPVPTDYSPKFDLTIKDTPKYSIPHSKLQIRQYDADQINSLVYKPNYYTGKQKYPQYSFGYAKQTDYSNVSPPPNLYATDKGKTQHFFNKTQNSFCVSDRPLPYGQHVKYPGVGSYDIKNLQPSHKIQFSIGRGDRPNNIIGQAPGVFYQIGGQLKNPGSGITISPQYALSQSKREDYPAPNAYNAQQPKNNKHIITTYANRAPLQNNAVLQYPSPQKYRTDINFYKKRSLSFTKQERLHQKVLLDVPGPGTYQFRQELSNQSGVMGKKLKKQEEQNTPGSNHYSPNENVVKYSPQRPINFQSNRVDFSKSITGKKVGPGSYLVQKQQKLALGKMSQSLKFQKNRNKNPGPGFYEIPSSIGKLPKYYTGAKKLTTDGFSLHALKLMERQKQEQQRLRQIEERQRKEQQIQRNQSIQSNSKVQP